MLCVKKIFHNDLMQLALIMSLLRLDYILYLNPSQERQQNTTSEYINTKNLDHILLNYERQLFDDLNSLGRYNPLGRRHAFQNISAYLLNVERDITQSIQEEEPEENAHGVTQEIDDFVQSPSNPLLMGDPFFRSDDVDDTAIKLEKFEDSDSASFLNDLGVEEDTFLDNFHDNLLFSNVAVPKIEEDVPDNIFAESLSLDDVAGSLVGELTQEDMDLIEVLWKQDVDLGFSLESEDVKVDPQLLEKALKAKESEKPTDEKVEPIENEACLKTERPDEELADPWNGLQYTIDTETGEYVLKSGSESTPPSSTCDIPLEDLDTLPLTLPDLLFEESFDEEQQKELYDSDIRETSSPLLTFESESLPIDPPTDEDDFLTMIQTAQLHSSHPHSFAQHPMNPYMRMNEQRWQDVAGLLDNTTSNATSYVALHHPYHIPHHHMAYGGTPEHHHHHHHHHHHQTFPNGTNLGSAVATSINLTGTSESIDSGAGASNYKMESPHDIMYFPNTSSEISNATDGFLSSILNDEDLQLMDMMGGNTEGGMYPIRMMDNNTLANTSSSRHNFDNLGSFSANAERMDASSDSAVSSMGSERIASLSDNEWGDATSDSGHNADYSPILDYANPNKYRPYDYQSYPQRPIEPNRVAQKKHQMFGKRFFQEGTYSNLPTPPKPLAKCGLEHPLYTPRSTLDHVHHNHTYNLPPESTATLQRPLFRDKGKGKSEDEPHLTRDEKRARALNVPLSVDDIINLPMDEFNERLSKFDLSEPQLSLIRDIRRRGKNKVAAQNCRKRKLDQILSLADEVKDMRDRKNRLMAEREFMVNERQRVKDKFTQLYRHVLRNLRDPDGNPYSPNLYSLQQSADGTVIIVPKGNLTEPTKDKKPPQ